MNSLPEEILCDIIINLDTKSIISFSETSNKNNHIYEINMKVYLK